MPVIDHSIPYYQYTCGRKDLVTSNLSLLFVFFRVRLISLAAQKFISDIANDALQHCKMRSTGQSARKGKVQSTHTCTLKPGVEKQQFSTVKEWLFIHHIWHNAKILSFIDSLLWNYNGARAHSWYGSCERVDLP